MLRIILNRFHPMKHLDTTAKNYGPLCWCGKIHEKPLGVNDVFYFHRLQYPVVEDKRTK